MNPEQLLGIALASLRAAPPPGLSLADVDGFAARNREALLAVIARAFPPVGHPTPGGGLRGQELAPAELAVDQRVVTEDGRHGAVAQVERIRISIGSGSAREEETHYTVILRLDSGREQSTRGSVFAELRRPAQVVPDIQVGRLWLAPAEVWRQLIRSWQRVAYLLEKAEGARKPDTKADWRSQAARNHAEFLETFALFAAWRARWPDEPLPDLTPLLWRQLSLAAQPTRSEDERWELAWLERTPKDWATRFQVGDTVLLHILGPHGREPSMGWTVERIDGHRATVTRGGERREELLWMLKTDDTAPRAEVFSQPKYLFDLGREMLTDGAYPKRSAVARAVKVYLGEKGLRVSSRVATGAGITSIDLSPAQGHWSPQDQARLRTLLPGVMVWNSQQGRLEPWQTAAEERSPYDDYGGKGAGVLIPAPELPRFAALLAEAMQAEGQSLNRLGERRLNAARPATRSPSPPPQAARAEGCSELVFDLPGHGQVRVVCGARGRRDTWHNVYVQSERYGFNGGRWARGAKPPEAVLAALRERGVGVFG